MKIKNHYAWISILWIISSIMDSVSCVVFFVNQSFGLAFLFLVLAVAFSFVGGILVTKAVEVFMHNKEVDWLHDFALELREMDNDPQEPFEEFQHNGRL